MRANDQGQSGMFSDLAPEKRAPKDPLRWTRRCGSCRRDSRGSTPERVGRRSSRTGSFGASAPGPLHGSAQATAVGVAGLQSAVARVCGTPCRRLGTQKMLAARYSSGSSGSAPSARCASRSACLASKASEMYLRKISPRTTCLYSAASMLLRSASAAAQSLASKPRLAVVSALLVLPFAMAPSWGSKWSAMARKPGSAAAGRGRARS